MKKWVLILETIQFALMCAIFALGIFCMVSDYHEMVVLLKYVTFGLIVIFAMVFWFKEWIERTEK